MGVDSIGIEDVEKSGLRLNPLHPVAESGHGRDVEPRLVRLACIGIEGDIGDGVGVTGDKRPVAQFAVEDFERPLTRRALGGDDGLGATRQFARQRLVAQRADIGFDLLLLETQPLMHFCARHRLAWQVCRAVGQIGQDGV